MTRRKVSPLLRQVPQAAQPAKPAEMPASVSDMISEGNPNTEEVAVTPAAPATGTSESAALTGSTSGQPETAERKRDHEDVDQNVKAGIGQPVDESDLFQNQLSEVQWGHRRGNGVASWGEGLGLAFLLRSAAADAVMLPLQQHGVHGREEGGEPRTDGSPAEMRRLSRAAEGRAP